MNLKQHLTIFSVIAGFVLGFIGTKFLVGSPINLILYVIGGVIIGYYSKIFRFAIINGFLFGFILSITYLISRYIGTTNFTPQVLLFSIFFGAIGGVTGLIAGFIGNFLNRFHKN